MTPFAHTCFCIIGFTLFVVVMFFATLGAIDAVVWMGGH